MASIFSKATWLITCVAGFPMLFLSCATHASEDGIGVEERDFQSVFDIVGTVRISGTPSVPLFTASVQAVSNKFVLFTDYLANKIILYTRDTSRLIAWGKQGANPGELEVPQSGRILDEARLVINDVGNRRFQVFDTSGTFLWLIPAAGQNESFFLGVDGGEPRLWTSGRAPCIGGAGTCLLHELDEYGARLRSIVNIDQRRDLVSSWAVEMDSVHNFYVMNRLSRVLEIYNVSGRRLRRQELKVPDWVELEKSEVVKLRKRSDGSLAKLLSEKHHTEIGALYCAGDALVLEVLQVNHDGPSTWKVEVYVYDIDSLDLVAFTRDAPGRLRMSTSGSLMFVQEEEADYGEVAINIARLKRSS